jgi:1-acyl-sn-glycerol-3-phosphate acyltransferase
VSATVARDDRQGSPAAFASAVSGEGYRHQTLAAAFAARLEHLLRRLGTGLLFAIFGAGAVALAGAVIPMLAFRSKGEARELTSQRLIHRAFGLFVRLGIALRLLGLKESGTERLERDAGLVVANHPTLLDIVFLISRMPQADCIVKRSAWRNPFLRGIVTAAGYLPNDGGEALVEACLERLRAGRSMVLFPEGSRSPEGGLGPFQRGAAHAALRSGCRVTPVVITCRPRALEKGMPWHEVPNRKLEYSLSVGESLRAEDLVDGDVSPALAARRVTASLRGYFETRLCRGNA